MTSPYSYPGMTTIQRFEITTDQILNIVCDYFKITKEQITEKNRKYEIVLARQIAIYLMVVFLPKKVRTSANIGNVFNQDRTMVNHSMNVIHRYLEVNDEYVVGSIKSLMIRVKSLK